MSDSPHEWLTIRETPKLYYEAGIEWCPRCGMLKTGPWAEYGAHHYFGYYIVGPKKDYPGPPWKPEGFGFPYEESNRDPPCQSITP